MEQRTRTEDCLHRADQAEQPLRFAERFRNDLAKEIQTTASGWVPKECQRIGKADKQAVPENGASAEFGQGSGSTRSTGQSRGSSDN